MVDIADMYSSITLTLNTDFAITHKNVQFEKADLDNNTKWFEEHYERYGEDMDTWAKMTDIFPWTNYYKWKSFKQRVCPDAPVRPGNREGDMSVLSHPIKASLLLPQL